MVDEPPPPDTPAKHSVRPLRAAEPEDVKQTLALRYRGCNRTDTASKAMAEITAERLFEHLAQSGFVVMHKTPARPGLNLHYAPFIERVRRGE